MILGTRVVLYFKGVLVVDKGLGTLGYTGARVVEVSTSLGKEVC